MKSKILSILLVAISVLLPLQAYAVTAAPEPAPIAFIRKVSEPLVPIMFIGEVTSNDVVKYGNELGSNGKLMIWVPSGGSIGSVDIKGKVIIPIKGILSGEHSGSFGLYQDTGLDKIQVGDKYLFTANKASLGAISFTSSLGTPIKLNAFSISLIVIMMVLCWTFVGLLEYRIYKKLKGKDISVSTRIAYWLTAPVLIIAFYFYLIPILAVLVAHI
jgi:uncharacterized membrane protein YuzA (DUF378 family)